MRIGQLAVTKLFAWRLVEFRWGNSMAVFSCLLYLLNLFSKSRPCVLTSTSCGIIYPKKCSTCLVKYLSTINKDKRVTSSGHVAIYTLQANTHWRLMCDSRKPQTDHWTHYRQNILYVFHTYSTRLYFGLGKKFLNQMLVCLVHTHMMLTYQ